MRADAISEAWEADALRVRIHHPAFGYVAGYSRGKHTGAGWTLDFSATDRRRALTFCKSDLRTSQDANNNGLLRLFTHGYGGLRLEIVANEEGAQ